MHFIGHKLRKVAIGLSGGVDSAVSSILLKKKGYEVVGVFMKNWDSMEESGTCSYAADLEDAEWICNKLNISLKVVDFVKEYWNDVFVRMVDEYVKGFTPNPDVWCNKLVKFNKFKDYAFNNIGCDAIATGHYANSSFGNFLEFYNTHEKVRLLKATDRQKDQTFFLCQIPQSALHKTMFPVGNLIKSEVKNIAFQNDFHRILKRKESMGICYIGLRNFKDFISEYVTDCNGRFISLDTGKQIGSHKGIHCWAIGERFRIAGHPNRTYIVQKVPENQDIYVATGHDHPANFNMGLQTFSPHWICDIPVPLRQNNNFVYECDFRVQHTHPLQKCTIINSDNGLIVNFDQPLHSVSPGQFIVLYKDNECLGGAEISKTGPSLYNIVH